MIGEEVLLTRFRLEDDTWGPLGGIDRILPRTWQWHCEVDECEGVGVGTVLADVMATLVSHLAAAHGVTT